MSLINSFKTKFQIIKQSIPIVEQKKFVAWFQFMRIFFVPNTFEAPCIMGDKANKPTKLLGSDTSSF